ncbi:GNAT family N-acetyltransferase [Exiguobacterium sp. Helios]|uniref:GNAT family N-acetyltransferase n=1 Tax=Exiguobacterium TaxID=33986 RepID=UPI00047D0012|nr:MULTISPECIES: GNAT family N-acetyltransferase [Exiguobacterium]MCK2157828.1 GNAT family N-acetyltransferase [Exiguobacterium sp. 17-1]QNR20617.1 GNAT family N-acetyltransferase [Exiguobacterium sp. Helios]RDB34615.1 GNAT family N-acetyltransferase [Exiguobacterium sp. RIT594]
MLVKYKKLNERTAMGLIAFSCEVKDPKYLLETVQTYEQDENQQLYLYKQDEDFIGIIGFQLVDGHAELKHIALSPSFRGERMSYMLLDAAEKMLRTEITGATDETSRLVEKWKNQ